MYGLTLTLLGCSISTPAAAPVHSLAQREASQPEPESVPTRNVPATIVTPTLVVDVEELFITGQTSLRQGRPADAAAAFDEIIRHDPGGPFAERALFQGALAHEATGDLEGAALRFEQLVHKLPEAVRGAEALVRSMRVRLYLEQWERAAEAGRLLLERYPHATPGARIIAHASRALGLLATERVSEAEYFIAKGMEIVDALALDRAGRIPRDLAHLYFALGEARRQRGEAVRLSGRVQEFAAQLEQRCQWLLSAQSAYSDVMRAYDAHWSTIAGFRVGQLYERLHTELMTVPMPRAGTPREQQLFEGAMRLRYSVLLNKASSMLDHTLAMARRTGEGSEWVTRTERSRRELTRAMAEEQQALDRLPFTRADLQRALDDLAARASVKPSSQPSTVGDSGGPGYRPKGAPADL